MEVRRDGEGRFFDEDSDFELEIGLRWPKVSENGPELFENFRKIRKSEKSFLIFSFNSMGIGNH